MTLQEIAAYHRTRWAKPWVLVSVFVIAAPILMMKAIGLLPSVGKHPATWISVVIAPFIYSGLMVWAAPLPFLWTGHKRDYPSMLRGAGQGILMGILLITLLILMEWSLFRWTRFTGIGSPWPILMANFALLLPLLILLGFLFAASERSSREKLKAEHQAKEAQWILLRGQLSPHVLFNALNGLAELVRVDPNAAEQGILDLAGLYRALLEHGSRSHAPMGDERKLLEQYLAVESIRLAQRMRVSWVWDPEVDDLITPPFLVQPLVENALKHGIAAHPEGGELKILSRRVGDDLVIQVRNTGKPLPLVPGDGVGVRNLEARLALAFEPDPKLRLYSEGEWTVAEIHIPRLFKEQKA